MIFGLAPKSSSQLGGVDASAMAYIVTRNNRFYVVSYDGIDPTTGKERRRWQLAGTSRADAEAIAGSTGDDARCGRRHNGRACGDDAHLVGGDPVLGSAPHVLAERGAERQCDLEAGEAQQDPSGTDRGAAHLPCRVHGAAVWWLDTTVMPRSRRSRGCAGG